MAAISKKVLIVHPDAQISDRFRRCILDSGYPADILCCNQMPKGRIETHAYDLIIADEESRLADGASLFKYLSSHPPAVAVILISKSGSVQRAVEAVRFGARDYLLKDSAVELVQASVEHALRRPPNPVDSNRRKPSENSPRPIITTAKAMQSLLAMADRVADAAATVLIQGESGTGKELLARYIHQQSHRRQRTFVAMNCAALPEHLAESELFGYEKGAFTGAVQKRAGKFEQAHLSTLLLDEISEMPMALQVKLLRVLQEKEVDHIGGKTPIPVDTRIIATTNRNLAEMVKAGKFREDLFYRLRVIPLKIPPLRDRREDIPLLSNHFLSKHCPGHLSQPPSLSAETMEALFKWPWPGNVRELENTIERAVLINDATTIGPESLLLDEEMTPISSAQSHALVGSTVREMEQKLIGETLDHLNQNRTHAAKMLGISIRTLRNKLKEYQTQPSDAEETAVGNSTPQ